MFSFQLQRCFKGTNTCLSRLVTLHTVQENVDANDSYKWIKNSITKVNTNIVQERRELNYVFIIRVTVQILCYLKISRHGLGAVSTCKPEFTHTHTHTHSHKFAHGTVPFKSVCLNLPVLTNSMLSGGNLAIS